MSNLIEFVISMKDMASKAVGAISSSVVEMGENINKGKKQSEDLSASVNELEGRLRDVNDVRFGTTLVSEFKDANNEAKALERQVKSLNNQMNQGGGFAARLAGWRSDFARSLPGGRFLSNPLTMAGGIVGGITQAVKKAAEDSEIRSRFQALTNDSIGSGFYDELKKFSIDSGVIGLEDMSENLIRANMDMSNIIPTLQMLGDITSGDAGMMNQLSVALTRAAADGGLTTRVLRRMQRAGFYPLRAVMAMTGESMESVRSRMDAGKISYNELYEAMKRTTEAGGEFHNALMKAGDNPAARFQKLKDTMSEMVIGIGDTFLPVFDKIIQGAQWIADKMGPFLKPAIVAIGALSVALLAAASAQWVLNLAIWKNPVGLIIAGVIALIAGIAYLIYNIQGWGEAWTHTVNAAKYLWQGFVAEAKWYWDTMINKLMIGLNKIQQGWYKFKNAVGLGSSDENNAMLSKIQADTDKRKREIESGQRAYLKLYQKSGEEINKAWGSLAWKGESYSDISKKIKGKFGGSGWDAEDFDGGSTLGSDVSGVSSNITSGGPRSITINIEREMIGQVAINSYNVREGVLDIEEMLEEMLRRILMSVTSS